ncbi:MAG: pentapeptide repeat-containing protein [Cyanobacteria bacterium J06632_19]
MKSLNFNRRIGLFIFKFLVIATVVFTLFLGLSQLKKKGDKIPFLKSFNYEILFLIDNIEGIGIVAGLLAFILNLPEQQKKSHYEAWQVINSGQSQRGSGGRIQALEDLVRDGVSLDGVVVSDAYLKGIKLSGAILHFANLEASRLDKSDLDDTKLIKANLKKAYLYKANLSGANLTKANLTEANLTEAKFNSAILNNANLSYAKLNATDLSNANLICALLINADLNGATLDGADLDGAMFWDKESGREAQNITAVLIKQAKNWQKAIYSPEFREKLGLPSEAEQKHT